jgi:hypothetical protein
VATFDVKSVKEVEVVSAITGVHTAEVAQTLSKGES